MKTLLAFCGDLVNFGYEISDIENALANGDRVIVAVDSGEYWMGESDDVYTPVDGADHAVEIIGQKCISKFNTSDIAIVKPV